MMNDEWFANKFIEISDKLGRIEQTNEDQSKSIERAFNKLKDHGRRIRKLENGHMVAKEKKNWVRENPGKSLTIGGLSVTTVAGIVIGVLKLLGVI